MPTDHERLKQELLEQAQQAIEKLLNELPEANEITLGDMEQATGDMGQAIMQQTLQSLVKEKHQALPDEVLCEHCHKRMLRRGNRKKRVVTVRGEVAVERQYYVCPSCRAGRFPPG